MEINKNRQAMARDRLESTKTEIEAKVYTGLQHLITGGLDEKL